MRKKTELLTQETEDELLVDLTFHDVPASLIAEFAEKIVRPYYCGNTNAAVQDLLHKAVIEQDFLLARITHARNAET